MASTVDEVAVQLSARGGAEVEAAMGHTRDVVGEDLQEMSVITESTARRFEHFSVNTVFALADMADGTERGVTRAGHALANLGFAFGPLAGSVAVGLAIVTERLMEGFAKMIHASDEAEQQLKKSIGDMANAGEWQKLNEKARDVWLGTPFDEKTGDLHGPSHGVAGAFEGSLADLENRMASLKAKIKGTGFLQDDITDLPINKAIRDLQPQLDKARQSFEDIKTAMDVMTSRPADQDIIPMKIFAQSGRGEAAEAERQWKQSIEHISQGIKEIGKELDTQSIDYWKEETRRGIEAMNKLHEELQQEIKEKQDSERSFLDFGLAIDKMGVKLQEPMRKVATEITDTFGQALAAGFERAFSGGGIGGGLKSLGDSILSGLGSIFVRMGESALAGLSIVQTITNALTSWNPAVGIPAAVGLIALGSALESAGHGSGSSHSVSAGATAVAGGGNYGTVTVGSSTGAASTKNLEPAQPVVFNATIIGPNDPSAQRAVKTLLARADRRGSTSGNQ